MIHVIMIIFLNLDHKLNQHKENSNLHLKRIIIIFRELNQLALDSDSKNLRKITTIVIIMRLVILGLKKTNQHHNINK